MKKIFLIINRNNYFQEDYDRKIEDIKFVMEYYFDEECEIIESDSDSSNCCQGFIDDAIKMSQADYCLFSNNYYMSTRSNEYEYLHILKSIAKLYGVISNKLCNRAICIRSYEDQLRSDDAKKLLNYNDIQKLNVITGYCTVFNDYVIIVKSEYKDITLSDYIDKNLLKIINKNILEDLNGVTKEQLININELGPVKYNKLINQLLDINKTKTNSIVIASSPFIKDI